MVNTTALLSDLRGSTRTRKVRSTIDIAEKSRFVVSPLNYETCTIVSQTNVFYCQERVIDKFLFLQDLTESEVSTFT